MCSQHSFHLEHTTLQSFNMYFHIWNIILHYPHNYCYLRSLCICWFLLKHQRKQIRCKLFCVLENTYTLAYTAFEFLCCFSAALVHEFQNLSKVYAEVRLTVRCMRRRMFARIIAYLNCIICDYITQWKEKWTYVSLSTYIDIVKHYGKCMRARAAWWKYLMRYSHWLIVVEYAHMMISKDLPFFMKLFKNIHRVFIGKY